MSYTTEQLLLAAKVRKLAVELRTGLRERDWFDLYGHLPVAAQPSEMQRNEWEIDWRLKHPLDTFMLDALNRIKHAADFIARHET